MSNPSAAGWHPDPASHEYRYFDGRQWTDQVSDNGVVSTDAAGLASIQAQARAAYAPPAPVTPKLAAGWHPDPLGKHEHRYFDGQLWSDQVSDSGQQLTDMAGVAALNSGLRQASPNMPARPQQPDWYKRPWVIITAVVVGLILVVAIANGGKSTSSDTTSTPSAAASSDNGSSDIGGSDTSSGSASTDEPKPKPKPKDCGNATDDCTPRVGPNGTVEVDALKYTITDAEAVTTLGDPDLFGETADGVFVVLTVKVHSNRDESATLTDVFHLEVNGKKYDPDSDGMVAAMGGGKKPFFLEDISPDSTTEGKVVFDVPKKVLGETPWLLITELGFGSTKGYIKLPNLQ